MFFRIATLVVGGALVAGCNSSRVQGTADYGGGNVYGDASYRNDNVLGDNEYRNRGRVNGEMAYRHSDNSDVKNVEATADARTASATLDADRARQAGEIAPANDNRQNENRPVVTPGNADPERAAYAATMRYPAEAKVQNDVPLTASVDDKRNELVIRNDSDQALNNLNVWIDGKYVAWVGTIPAHERVSLRMASFSDASGRSLKNWGEANSVQLQSGDRLFNTTGLEKRL
jgi:hypothetical protein